ncbi:hypothetical protein NX059_004009 [Plenodomus lindquistii]|nr:hypothetical protein NX059_004009 [Plenodomus lindquistii]
MLRPRIAKSSFYQSISAPSFIAAPLCRPPPPRLPRNIRQNPRAGLMFRAQVLRRNFSLFNRVPHSRIVRSAARDGHESIIIHRFRIQKPVFSRTRLVGTIVVALALHGLTRYLGVEVEVQVVSEEERKAARNGHTNNEWQHAGQEITDEDSEDDDGMDNVLLFLPTGLSRPGPRTFYKGSDPEWQEFRRIATDKPRAEKIRGELVTMVRSMIAGIPQWEAKIGKVDPTKGKSWVEIMFPDGPPIEYERPGIALTEDLQWVKATRPVEDVHHHKLNSLLRPTGVANAVYQDVKRKASQTWQGLKVYVGWEQKVAPISIPLMLPPVGALPTPNSTAPSATATSPDPSATSSANDTKQPTPPASISASPAPVDGPSSSLGFLLPDPKKLTMDLARFRQDAAKASKPLTTQAPRGAFTVVGLIDIHGARARVTLNVKAVYDPKQGKYLGLQVGVFNFAEHKQAPKGGP